MVKLRLHTKDNLSVARGTLHINEGHTIIGLQLVKDTQLMEDYKKIINDFLKKNNLIIVSQEGSFRTHKSVNNYTSKPKGFDVYIKERLFNKKIVLKKIEDSE